MKIVRTLSIAMAALLGSVSAQAAGDCFAVRPNRVASGESALPLGATLPQPELASQANCNDGFLMVPGMGSFSMGIVGQSGFFFSLFSDQIEKEREANERRLKKIFYCMDRVKECKNIANTYANAGRMQCANSTISVNAGFGARGASAGMALQTANPKMFETCERELTDAVLGFARDTCQRISTECQGM